MADPGPFAPASNGGGIALFGLRRLQGLLARPGPPPRGRLDPADLTQALEHGPDSGNCRPLRMLPGDLPPSFTGAVVVAAAAWHRRVSCGSASAGTAAGSRPMPGLSVKGWCSMTQRTFTNISPLSTPIFSRLRCMRSECRSSEISVRHPHRHAGEHRHRVPFQIPAPAPDLIRGPSE